MRLTMASEARPQRSLTKMQALARLRQEMRLAMPPERRLVFGEGSPEAILSIVGEAPGREEEALGRPFVGAAGQLLDQLLAKHSFRREELWITNVVKWRPTEEDHRSRTRAPRLSEVNLSRGWLLKELEIVNPRIILCLGNVAARALIDSRFRMSADHGHWGEGLYGVVALATFHPAYVLRQGSRRGRVWDGVNRDFQMVKARYEQLKSLE